MLHTYFNSVIVIKVVQISTLDHHDHDAESTFAEWSKKKQEVLLLIPSKKTFIRSSKSQNLSDTIDLVHVQCGCQPSRMVSRKSLVPMSGQSLDNLIMTVFQTIGHPRILSLF